MGAKESREQPTTVGSHIARNRRYRGQLNIIASKNDLVRFQYGTHPQVLSMRGGRREVDGDMINDLDFFMYTIFRIIETYVRQGPNSRDIIVRDPRLEWASASLPGSPKGSPREHADGRIQKQRSVEKTSDTRIPKQRDTPKGAYIVRYGDMLSRQKSAEFQRILSRSESPKIDECAATPHNGSPRMVKVSSQADLLREMRPKNKLLEDRIAIREYVDDTSYVSPMRDEIIGIAKRIVCDMLTSGDVDTAAMSMSTYAHGLGSDGLPLEILALFNFRSLDPARMEGLFTDGLSKIAFPSIKLFYHLDLYMPFFALAPILGMRMHVREMNHLLSLAPDVLFKTYDGDRIVLEALLDPISSVIPKEQHNDLAMVTFLPAPYHESVTPFVKGRVVSLLRVYGMRDSKGDKLTPRAHVCEPIHMLNTWYDCLRF